jgi:GT2 family glycosyltransferase
MSPEPCVSVVVVTYESRNFIGSCLESVYRTGAEWIAECRVVDNASRDGTVDWVRDNFAHVELVAKGENSGFGRAVNTAAHAARGEFLLVLNPDVVLEAGALAELVCFLRHRMQAAACGPKVVGPDGRFRWDCRRGFPTPLNALGYFTGLDRAFTQSRTLAGYHRRWLSPEVEVTTDCLSGSCMLVRRGAFESIGGFDEDYFLFGEDIDLCWRLSRKGMEIWYVPAAKVIHAKGVSMCLTPGRARREFYRSMRLFMDKRLTTFYPRPVLFLAKAGVRAAELLGSRYRFPSEHETGGVHRRV